MSYKIPLFDVNVGQAEANAVADTIMSGWLSTGPKCAEFEDKFSKMFGSTYALTLSNCTVALHLAVKLCGIKPGDEVICPSLTFVATVNAIKYEGGVPVFCDIESLEKPVIGAEQIKPLITPKTKAIIVMHYAGFPCDMDAIMELANEKGLKVIEDACHAPLSEYKGRKLGTIGDFGCFSFFSNKNISTGEGGMLITNSEEYYERAKLLRSHGMTTLSYQRAKGHAVSYDVVDVGYNYRMDDIRATIGLVQLDGLKKDLEKRIAVREWYVERLSKLDKVIVPFELHDEFSSNYVFSIVVKEINKEQRDEIRNKLHEAGVQTSMHYPPVHLFSSYYNEDISLSVTEKYADQALTLPMYSNLKEEEVQYIFDVLSQTLEGY